MKIVVAVINLKTGECKKALLILLKRVLINRAELQVCRKQSVAKRQGERVQRRQVSADTLHPCGIKTFVYNIYIENQVHKFAS